MPTCSQAKIITNLESSDLNRRLFSLVIDEDSNTTKSRSTATVGSVGVGVVGGAETTTGVHVESSAFELDLKPSHQQPVPKQPRISHHSNQASLRRMSKKHDCVNKNRSSLLNRAIEISSLQHPQQSQSHQSSTIRLQRKITIDELPQHHANNQRDPQLAMSTRESNFQLLRLHKVPIVFGEVVQPMRRNPYTNTSSNGGGSKYNGIRTQQLSSYMMNNQMRVGNMLRSELNLNLISQRQQCLLFGLAPNGRHPAHAGWCGSDDGGGGEEYDNEMDGQQSAGTPTTSSSSTTTSTASRASCSDDGAVGGGVVSPTNQNHNSTRTGLPNASLSNRKKSFDYWQCLPIR